MPGAAGSFDVKLLAAFDVCFCLVMNLLNPSLSTNKLFSLAISAVRSNGNPNVSWSLKITSPGIVLSLILTNCGFKPIYNSKNSNFEIIEIENHPWFVGVQYHPEYKSTVSNPHPLFISFVQASLAQKGK